MLYLHRGQQEINRKTISLLIYKNKKALDILRGFCYKLGDYPDAPFGRSGFRGAQPDFTPLLRGSHNKKRVLF